MNEGALHSPSRRLVAALRSLHPLTIFLGIWVVIHIVSSVINAVPYIGTDLRNWHEEYVAQLRFHWSNLGSLAFLGTAISRSFIYLGVAATFEFLVRIHREFRLLPPDDH